MCRAPSRAFEFSPRNPITGREVCSDCARTGHAMLIPKSAITSRRFTQSPRQQGRGAWPEFSSQNAHRRLVLMIIPVRSSSNDLPLAPDLNDVVGAAEAAVDASILAG